MFEDVKILAAIECQGLGDIISSTPLIKVMSENIYKKPICVATHLPDFFKNFPYIDKIYHIDEHIKNCHIIRTFNVDKIKKYEVSHEKMDIRQLHAICSGFMLLPEQMTCEYYPDPYEPVDNLPDKFVAVHPAQTWASRTWDKDKWQSLINNLNAAGVAVVAVGKTNSSAPDCIKPIFDINIENGLNLCDDLTLSQCWHVLNQASVVVTMDSGILHLAGTTDSYIVQLGSSINPYYRAPYRNKTQNYKYSYIKGKCDKYCISSMSYMFNERPLKVDGCAEQYETFECHPSVDQVFEKTMKVLSNESQKNI